MFLKPQLEDRIDNPRYVVGVEDYDFFFCQSFLEPVDVGRGVEPVLGDDLGRTDFGHSVKYGPEQIELIPAQALGNLLVAESVGIEQ